MQKLGIKQIHTFITKNLRDEIFIRYENYEILCEADLQSHVWQVLVQYFQNNEERKGLFKVLNKPYLKEIKIHPDLVIFRRDKPFIVIELKEWRSPKQKSGNKDLQRLLGTKMHYFEIHKHRIKRGYLMYVSWVQTKKIFEGSKGDAARFLFEIPVVPENIDPIKFKEWKKGFKKWAKYVQKS